ncbi:MAG: Trm112 family protein [Actinobacteria bacterium]|nr:Trm112 family protein [Actinomycetota bacterium]
MSLDPDLVSVLACPIDHGQLFVFDDENCIYNPRLKCRYTIREGIAVMLVDESEVVSDGEHERLAARIARGEARATGSAAA